MKTKIFYLFLFLFCCGTVVNAQEPLKADAGENKHFCFETDWIMTTLGGNPTASDGVSPYTYYWWTNNGNGMIHEITTSNPCISFLGDIIAYVKVTDAAENIAMDSVVITVSAYPYHGSDCYVQKKYYISRGDSVWLDKHCACIDASYTTCSWKISGGEHVNNICDGFWVKPELTTSYYLTITDVHGCSEGFRLPNPIYKVFVDEVGIESHDVSTPVKVFPNPASEILYFSKETDFEILDIQGRTLLQSKYPVEFINISHLINGLYFVKIENQIMKFIKTTNF